MHGLQTPLYIYRVPEGTKWIVIAVNEGTSIATSEIAKAIGPGLVYFTVEDDVVAYYADNQAYAQTTANPTIERMKESGLIPS